MAENYFGFEPAAENGAVAAPAQDFGFEPVEQTQDFGFEPIAASAQVAPEPQQPAQSETWGDFAARVPAVASESALTGVAGLARLASSDSWLGRITRFMAGVVPTNDRAFRSVMAPVADFASEAAGRSREDYGVNQAMDNSLGSKVATGIGGLISAAPMVAAGPTGFATLLASAFGGAKESDYKRLLEEGKDEATAQRESDQSAAIKTGITAPLYLVAGSLANRAAAAIPSATPLVRSAVSFLANTAGNTASAAVGRGVEAAIDQRPIGEAVGNFTIPGFIQDVAFAGHGAVEFHNAVTKARDNARDLVENRGDTFDRHMEMLRGEGDPTVVQNISNSLRFVTAQAHDLLQHNNDPLANAGEAAFYREVQGKYNDAQRQLEIAAEHEKSGLPDAAAAAREVGINLRNEALNLMGQPKPTENNAIENPTTAPADGRVLESQESAPRERQVPTDEGIQGVPEVGQRPLQEAETVISERAGVEPRADTQRGQPPIAAEERAPAVETAAPSDAGPAQQTSTDTAAPASAEVAQATDSGVPRTVEPEPPVGRVGDADVTREAETSRLGQQEGQTVRETPINTDIISLPEGAESGFKVKAGGATGTVVEYPDRLVLRDLVSTSEGRGDATKVIDHLKQKGKPIELKVGETRTPRERLNEFYSRRGFVQDPQNPESFRYEPKGEPILTSFTPDRRETNRVDRGDAHHAEISRVANRVAEYMPGIRLHVFKDEAQLPERVRNVIRQDAIHEGLVDTQSGDVWLFSDALENPRRATEVLMHEIVGHYGVEKILPNKEWRNIEESVFKNQQVAIESLSRLYFKKGTQDLTTSERREVTGEYLARLAERPQDNPNLWQKVVVAIRKALRNLGVVRRWSDEEIRDLIRRSAKAVQEAPDLSRDFREGGIRSERQDPTRASLAEEPEGAKPPPLPATGIKNEVVNAERADRGELSVLKDFEQSNAETDAMAKQRLEQNPEYGRQLVTDILEGNRTGDNVDQAVLLRERVRLMNERNAVADQLAKPETSEQLRSAKRLEWQDLQDRINLLDHAADYSGTTAGRTLQYRRRLMREDFSLAALERKARVELQRDLTEPEVAKIREQATRIKELQDKLDNYETNRVENDRTRALEATIADLNRQVKAQGIDQRVLTFADDVVTGWEREAESAAERLAKRFGGQKVRASLSEVAATNALDADVLRDVVLVAKAKIGRGLSDAAKFADQLAQEAGEGARQYADAAWKEANSQIDQLATSQPEPTGKTRQVKIVGTPEQKQQAIAERMQALKQSAGTDFETADLRGLVQKLSLELVRGGVKDRETLVDRVHDVVKEIVPIDRRATQDLISGYGDFKPLDKEAAKQTLRGLKGELQQTGKLQDLESRQPLKKTGVERRAITDNERRLLRLVNEYKKRYGVITTDPTAQLKSAQDAIKTRLKNQIKDLAVRIETGEKPVNKTQVEYDAEMQSLRDLKERMQATVDAIEGKQQMSDEDRAKLIMRSLHEQISDYERRIRESDTSPKASGKKLSTPEIEALKARRDAVREEYREMEMIDADLQDQRNAKRLESSIDQTRKSIADLDARIAAGDLSVRSKREGPTSGELQRLRAERTAMNKLLTQLRKEAQPRRSPEEIALQSTKARMASQLAKIQERIAAGDFAPRVKKEPVALDKEGTDLKFEVEQAKQQFNEGVLKWKLEQRTKGEKALDAVKETLNTTRAVMTSADLSGVLRQGGFVALSHPIMAAKAIPAMFKAMGSERGQFEVNNEIQQRDNAKSGLYEKAKLYLSDPNASSLSQMEEAYMARWVKRIPKWIGGGLIRGSERAYTTFLNRVRADAFDQLAARLTETGKPTLEEAKAIANFVNVVTGRGDLGKFSAAAVPLNTVFFAPRYVASRFQTLLGQPLYQGNARTRKLIASEYARYLGGVAVVMGLMSMAQDQTDAGIELDPRSSDFLKVKFGNTRVDPLSGLAQSAVLMSRLATGKTKTAGGELRPISGDTIPFGGGDAFDVAARFARTKFSPAFGATWDLLSGKNVVGERVTPLETAGKFFIPISLVDIYSVMKDQGIPKGPALTVLSLLGMGVTTQPPRKTESMERAKIRKRLSKGGKLVSEQQVDAALYRARLKEMSNTP